MTFSDPRLLDAIPIGIALAEDASAARIRVNRHLARLLGIARGQNASLTATSGTPNFTVVRDGQVVAADDLPVQIAARTNAVVCDWRAEVVRPDGERIPITGHALPIRDSSGAAIGGLGIFLDASAVQRAEFKRSEAEAQLRQVLDSMSDGFAALDHEYRLTYVNERCAQVVRVPRDQLIGRLVWDVFPDGPRLRVHDAIERAMRERIPIVLEDYYSPLDLWCEMRVYPIPDGLASFITDGADDRQQDGARNLVGATRAFEILGTRDNLGPLIEEINRSVRPHRELHR